MNCYNCRFEFDQPKAATNAGTGLPSPSPNTKGALFFCGACGHPNVEQDGGLRAITAEEWDALDTETRNDLHFAMRQVAAAQKRQSRKIINPVEELLLKLRCENPPSP